jgi:hypothetical protein
MFTHKYMTTHWCNDWKNLLLEYHQNHELTKVFVVEGRQTFFLKNYRLTRRTFLDQCGFIFEFLLCVYNEICRNSSISNCKYVLVHSRYVLTYNYNYTQLDIIIAMHCESNILVPACIHSCMCIWLHFTYVCTQEYDYMLT